MQEYLDEDRRAREPADAIAHRLALSPGSRAVLRYLLDRRLEELCCETKAVLQQVSDHSREREDLEHSLAATPAEDDIKKFVERLQETTGARARLEQRAKQLDADLGAKKLELTSCQTKLSRILESRPARETETEDRQRMLRLAGRTRETMGEFLEWATQQKIDRLSALITESFRFLLRKQTLVERILIHPSTFAVTLYDSEGQAIPRQCLSEREKQLFAVAMLWGLAQASARPLPAVIDTPMARLDSAHRQNLVERYFPHASHQVIVLSTDTEVDRHYYELIQPFMARAYHLDYDEAAKATHAREGYFWKERI